MIDNLKKYKAFTIQEMMVVLIIAALVVSMAILALDLVQKELLGIQKGLSAKTEIRLLEKTLLNDLNSLEMKYQSAAGTLHGFSELAQVNYRLSPEFVRRNKDTFFVKIDSVQFFLDNQKVSSGTVDAIDIQIGNRKFFVYKKKAAAHEMRQLWDLK